MKLLIADSSKETGALLGEYLEAMGATDDPKAVVCYGIGTQIRRSLNSRCGMDKIKRLVIMKDAHVRTVPWFAGDVPANVRFPLLARRRIGHGGTDIVPVFQRQDVEWRKAAGWDWFSEYVPVQNEYRVWIFRNEHLDTYEKKMVRPSDYKYIGRNFRNGFDFVLGTRQGDAFSEADAALKALGLDFGAVDLLRGEDGKIYVLEVNTAPGVIKSGAHNTLAKLADCIVKWQNDGYPTTW